MIDITDKFVENLKGFELDELQDNAHLQKQSRIERAGHFDFLLRVPIVYYGVTLG